ncbi:VUT family protein [Polycladidibacter stylochi]|uniref:VUT family protein n=1 Tax=Polycladidibacter stylochi TaxID=1807766 RepID=UPI00082C2D75|nr:VUT family protein [Pseudovibrio stylochi]
MSAKKAVQAQPLIYGIAAMTAVVVASNYLVQFPVHATLGSLNLADLLTWGAFTYPLAFVVTDLTNRQYGPATARRIVYAGFAVAVVLSIYLATYRIAVASGIAFMCGQLLDVYVFNRLRTLSWWKAPVVSSVLGGVLDTILFFGIAFSASFAFMGYYDAFAVESAPMFGMLPVDVPRWVSWAVGDFSVKMCVSMCMLVPYRVVLSLLGAAPDLQRG